MFMPHMSNLSWLPMFINFNLYVYFCFSIMQNPPSLTKNKLFLMNNSKNQKWQW